MPSSGEPRRGTPAAGALIVTITSLAAALAVSGSVTCEIAGRERWGLETGAVREISRRGSVHTVGRYLVLGPIILRCSLERWAG